MKRYTFMVIVIGIAMITILTTCSPATQPATLPPSALPAPVSTPPSNISSVRQAQDIPPIPQSLTSQDAAWAKIVDAAKKEGKLTIYSANLVGEIGFNVAKAFKERYDVTLEIITGRGAEFTERVKVEKRIGRLVGDLYEGSSGFAENMKTEGLTESLAHVLPVFREQSVWRANVFINDTTDKHIIGETVGYWSPWINTRQVAAANVPQVWRDLLKPQWKGKMLLTDPKTSVAGIQNFVTLMREKAIDEEFVKALYGQDLRFTVVGADDAATLARGERWLSIRGAASTYSRYVAEGAPLKAIDMKDGVVSTVSPVLIVFAGGPHPNATRFYVNWFLSQEGQNLWTRAASTTSIRKDVTDYLAEAARLTPQKPFPHTNEDGQKATQLYREQWLDKLWGRQ